MERKVRPPGLGDVITKCVAFYQFPFCEIFKKVAENIYAKHHLVELA